MSKKSTRTKESRLIRTRGIGLSVKLFRLNGTEKGASEIMKVLETYTYQPSENNGGAGFKNLKVSGKTVGGEFVASFPVAVLNYDSEGNIMPVHYMSFDRGEVLVKTDRQTVEVRGSERIARKFKRVFEELTGLELSPLNLNGGTLKLYETATEIDAVLVTGLDKGNLTQAEFRGSGIQREDEIGMYTRRYKGQISRFRGTFPYPSGALLTTTVNTLSGSFTVYKSGDGILEKDLNWIVELMENAAHGT
ncbi:MAG: hypothetical protein QXS20_06565 [Candidatus Thorarchaeota archaeon]